MAVKRRKVVRKRKVQPNLRQELTAAMNLLNDRRLILDLEQNEIDGAVAGKAIYEGKVDLKEVFQCLQKE